MSTGADHAAQLKFVVTNTLIVRDIKRSIAFYRYAHGQPSPRRSGYTPPDSIDHILSRSAFYSTP